MLAGILFTELSFFRYSLGIVCTLMQPLQKCIILLFSIKKFFGDRHGCHTEKYWQLWVDKTNKKQGINNKNEQQKESD